MDSSSRAAGVQVQPHLGVLLLPHVEWSCKVHSGGLEWSGLSDSKFWQWRWWDSSLWGSLLLAAGWAVVDQSAYELPPLHQPVSCSDLCESLLDSIVANLPVCLCGNQRG